MHSAKYANLILHGMAGLNKLFIVNFFPVPISTPAPLVSLSFAPLWFSIPSLFVPPSRPSHLSTPPYISYFEPNYPLTCCRGNHCMMELRCPPDITSVSARWRTPFAVILCDFGEIIFTTAVPMLKPIFCALFPLLCCNRKLKEYKNTQPLIGMPEPLSETGVLANHSSDFSQAKWTASQPARPVYGGRTTT